MQTPCALKDHYSVEYNKVHLFWNLIVLCITTHSGLTHFNNLSVNAAKPLKCISPFWDVMHWKVNSYLHNWNQQSPTQRITCDLTRNGVRAKQNVLSLNMVANSGRHIFSKNQLHIFLCPCLGLGQFMSYFCDHSLFWAFIFIVINHITSLKQTHLFFVHFLECLLLLLDNNGESSVSGCCLAFA